jgi:hypothetical protein
MRAHPGHADPQYNGINALRHLVVGHAANRAAAGAAWAVEAVVAALRAHPNDAAEPLTRLVQEEGSLVLQILEPGHALAHESSDDY